jgi:hypothetical protein
MKIHATDHGPLIYTTIEGKGYALCFSGGDAARLRRTLDGVLDRDLLGDGRQKVPARLRGQIATEVVKHLGSAALEVHATNTGPVLYLTLSGPGHAHCFSGESASLLRTLAEEALGRDLIRDGGQELPSGPGEEIAAAVEQILANVGA